MKLKVILSSVLLLAGCSGYTENHDISDQPGFEDCKALTSFWSSTTIVRCPNSTTTSVTETEDSSNKTTVLDGN